MEAVRDRTDHPSADEIYLDVRKKDNRISRGTVYRNLSILARNREISHVKVPTADRYDLRSDHHYHMFCIACDSVFDAPISYQIDYDTQVENETGFQIQRHRMVFEGLCPSCRAKSEAPEEE